MGGPERFSFMFNPRFWALPVLICWDRRWYGSHRQIEVGLWFGPLGLSVIFGKLGDA